MIVFDLLIFVLFMYWKCQTIDTLGLDEENNGYAVRDQLLYAL